MAAPIKPRPATLKPLHETSSEQFNAEQMKQAIHHHKQKQKEDALTSKPQDEVRLTQSQESSLPFSKGETSQENEVTQSQVEEWFANAEKALRAETQDKTGPVAQVSNDRELGAKFLGRFGLKSAKDVVTFLNSEAGATVKEMVAARLSEREAIAQEQRFQQHEKEALKKRQLAYFLAGVMAHKAAKAKELNRAYAEAGQKAIERSKENATGGSSHNASETGAAHAASLSQQLAVYENVIKGLEEQLTGKKAQAAAITSQITSIQQNYATLNSHVAQAHAHYAQAMAPNLSQTTVVNALQHRIAHVQRQIEQKRLEESSLRARHKHHIAQDVALESIDLVKLLAALQKQHQKHLAQENLPPSLEDRIEVIESKIAHLSDNLEKQLGEIHRLLDPCTVDGRKKPLTKLVEDELKAMAMIVEHRGLHSEIAALKDMVDVLKGKKFLFDEKGNKTDSYKDAVCILSPQQRLVKDNGKFYVLGPLQSLDSMSDHEKHRAHQKFIETKTLDKLLQHNEHKEIKGKKSELQKIDAEIHELSQQIQFVQQQKAEVNEALRALNHNPRPQHHFSGPGIFNPTPKPVPSETWLQIERILDKLRNNPTKEDVKNLRDLIPKDNHKLRDMFKKALNANSEVEMRRYLQTIELSGVLAYKPAVIAITSPQTQKSSEFQSSSESPLPPFHPTPFSDPFDPFK